MLNKKGQVAETMTWVVATLVIIILLSISIFGATLIAKTKMGEGSGYSRTQDVVMDNSLFAYFQIKDSKIQSKVNEDLKKISEQEFSYDYDYDYDSRFKKFKAYLE